MDPETEQQLGEEVEVEEVVTTAPETLVVKRRGRPPGARNINKTTVESSTGGTNETPASVPDPLYTALMKRLDTMEATMKQSPPKVKRGNGHRERLRWPRHQLGNQSFGFKGRPEQRPGN
jgi:hypothetical protein